MSTTADIVWALQQQQQQQQQQRRRQWHRQQAAEKVAPPFFGSGNKTSTTDGGGGGSGGGGGRKVDLTVLRGFPKSDKPWMPRLKVEPSPTGTVLTPPSSAVESPGSDETDVPSPELSAPGRKTFSGTGASRGSTLGFAGGGSGAGASGRSARSAGGVTAKIYPAEEQQQQPPLSAATVESGYGALPPSPETAVSTPARVHRPFGNTASRNMSSSETPVAAAAAERKQTYISTRASTVEIGNVNSISNSSSITPAALTVVAPRTPEAVKNEDDSGDGGDSNGNEADSADSNGGGRARGPAPTQANANAGGDPAVPFSSFRGGGRATPAASAASQPGEEQDQQQEQDRQDQQGQADEERRSSFLGLEVGNALAACWGVEVYADSSSRPAEFDADNAEAVDDTPVLRPAPVLLAVSASTSATSSTVAGGSVRDDASTGSGGRRGKHDGNDDDVDDDDDDDFQDTRSVASSSQSSLMLTAVSPSRVPPPLVSVASTIPLPPVSRASSVVSSSFSNPWHSPTAADVADAAPGDEDLDSMSWLQPLPSPPPREAVAIDSSAQQQGQGQGQQRKQQQQQQQQQGQFQHHQQDYGPFVASSANMSGSATTPPSNRAGTGGAYPSGRWVQTPQRGEILRPLQAEPKFGGSKPGSDEEDTGSLD